MSEAALSNAILAMQYGPFGDDAAQAVTNDGCRDGAARWFIGIAAAFLRDAGQADGPIAAFDFAAEDWERLNRVWPIMHAAADMLDAHAVLPGLARFIAEDAMSEPPTSLSEQHAAAWEQKQELRR